MRVTFMHLRNTRNIGDRWCSPYDWFDWPDSVEVRDIKTAGPSYDVGIYGGGRIFGGLSKFAGVHMSPDALHIAWGVGTLQGFPLSWKYTRARRLCDLVGSRDYSDQRYSKSPCVSCLAPHFDSPTNPVHDAVFYYHAGKTLKQKIKIPDTMPKLSNNCDTLEEALDFISSGKTVISNSYHGVYWALLMGRKVICIPFSKKFSAYPENPHYSTPKRWLSELDSGVSHPLMLQKCRTEVMKFKKRVDRLLEQNCDTRI